LLMVNDLTPYKCRYKPLHFHNVLTISNLEKSFSIVLDKGESLKYCQEYENNRTASCGRITLLILADVMLLQQRKFSPAANEFHGPNLMVGSGTVNSRTDSS
jgi:hypothetical protein